MEEVQRFMEDYNKTHQLVVLCRNFVYPIYNSVRFTGGSDPRQMPVKELFTQLELNPEQLGEVYETVKLGFLEHVVSFLRHGKKVVFSGRFTENGKQRLADILQKEITFGYQPDSDPIAYSPETFRPAENHL